MIGVTRKLGKPNENSRKDCVSWKPWHTEAICGSHGGKSIGLFCLSTVVWQLY